jgi:tricorn protease interacting factor F2/3
LDVSSYDLSIDLDFQGLKYKGTVGINLKTPNDVLLNSVDLEIERAHSGATDFPFKLDDGNLTIATGPFDGVLQVDYSGRIPDSLAGIYRAPYENTHIVTTHLEAAQARRMFPCIDRPDMKATFKLSVRIDNELEAISNMPVASQRSDGNKKILTFQPTPRMSTYLLYLGVGRFQSRTSKIGGTEVIVSTLPGKVQKGAFAEEEAKKAIDFFNSYYKIPYMLPKVHLVGVPEFPMGAMENWGAISFREILLLVDENTSSSIKRRTAMAIAHELAHQWFGDLVTMKWWDDIWLNESFATYMAYKAIDHAHPDWRIWENFFNGDPSVESLSGSMRRDFLQNTHPIQVKVDSPEEIEQVFDEISYGKGAHVLQMIDTYVGEDAFREGVRRYLAAHAYSNATGNDLWSAIEEASGKPVKKIMAAWIRQAGFPVVTLNLNDGKLELAQERMLLSGKHEQLTWPIPVIMEANGQRKNILMENSTAEINVNGLKTLRINPDRTGFYAISSKNLTDMIRGSRPTAYDRWGFIFDALMFVLSGKMKLEEYLATLRKFEHEQDRLPAQELSDQLERLYTLAPSKMLEMSKKLHRSLLNTFKDRSDENSSVLTGILATRLAELDPEYASTLASRFKEYAKVAPDMRLAVAIAYAKSTNDLETMQGQYRRSGSDEDKVKLLAAMTVFSDEKLIERTLEFAFSGEVKRQDILRAVSGLVGNPHVRNLAWNWLKSNLGKLEELYHGTGILSLSFASFIPLLGLGRVSEVESFFAEHQIPEAETGIKVGLEKLHAYDRLATEIMNSPSV